jgi:hypothetical protein
MVACLLVRAMEVGGGREGVVNSPACVPRGNVVEVKAAVLGYPRLVTLEGASVLTPDDLWRRAALGSTGQLDYGVGLDLHVLGLEHEPRHLVVAAQDVDVGAHLGKAPGPASLAYVARRVALLSREDLEAAVAVLEEDAAVRPEPRAVAPPLDPRRRRIAIDATYQHYVRTRGHLRH